MFEWPATMLAAKSHWTRLWHVRLQIARDCYNRNVAMSAFKTSIGIRLTWQVLSAGSLVYVPGGRFHILHSLPTDVDSKTAELVPWCL